ncbi:MAG: hypothetical protein AAF206_30320 [Bacteroidota bacterium]
MDLELLFEILGWLGSLMIVVAYGLVSFKKIDAESLIYQWLNVLGSIGMIVITAYREAWPSTFVNVVWLFIGVPALVKIFWQKKAPVQQTPKPEGKN